MLLVKQIEELIDALYKYCKITLHSIPYACMSLCLMLYDIIQIAIDAGFLLLVTLTYNLINLIIIRSIPAYHIPSSTVCLIRKNSPKAQKDRTNIYSYYINLNNELVQSPTMWKKLVV